MPGRLQTIAFSGVFPRKCRETIVALQQWEEKWQTSSRHRNKIKQEREWENEMWLRWVHHFIVYCYNQIATRSNLRGELFWVTLKGWNLPWQGRNGCGSKRQLVTCMHIQNEGKGPLVFSFSLSPPSGTLAHVVMLPTFLSQGIPETQLWKHPHGHVYCGASGTP